MPTFLSDPTPTFYGFLAVMVIVLLLLFLRRGQRGDLIRLGIGAGIFVAVVLIDKFVESPREESSRKVQEMAAGSRAKSIGDISRHMAESYSYGGRDKTQEVNRFESGLRISEFNGVDVSGFSHADVETIDDNKIKVGFEVWPNGYGLPEFRYFCWATFVKEPDGQFRMKTFDLYPKRPIGDEKPVVPSQLQ